MVKQTNSIAGTGETFVFVTATKLALGSNWCQGRDMTLTADCSATVGIFVHFHSAVHLQGAVFN
jgi:hypothetical protein